MSPPDGYDFEIESNMVSRRVVGKLNTSCVCRERAALFCGSSSEYSYSSCILDKTSAGQPPGLAHCLS